VIFQVLEGAAVLLNLDTELYFRLNDVGAAMWRMLAEGTAPDQVVEELLPRYEVEAATLRADLERLIADLVAAGLLVVSPPGEQQRR
jgi:hypothetical protein